MMVKLRVDLEITDNRANNLAVRPFHAVEILPLEDREQLLQIAMFPAQTLNDHVGDPRTEPRL
jgi:hypothetical protein